MPSEHTFEIDVLRDVRIPTLDSDSLSGDIYIPVGAGPVPALIGVYPYRKDVPRWETASQRWFAQQGYACLYVEHAGVGSSDGVPHAPWSSGEVDDAIAVIDWAAAQSWCNGVVGMWGASHGGTTTMGAAARHPSQLKAIMPMICLVDADPDGARNDAARLALWGGLTLCEQLRPSLLNYASRDEQRRWQRRLHEIEPYVVGMAELGPRDPEWQERRVDPSMISVPALCVGGWRDIHCRATLDAFEQMSGPKKLLMGPWGHVPPHRSRFEPVDFHRIALRWWDHWLRGIDTGVMDEPPITLYMTGSRPGWRNFDAWPTTTREYLLSAAGDATLVPTRSGATQSGDVITEYEPDPTGGALSGLRGLVFGELGELDQHDDDLRAVALTTEPIAQDIAICGRPEVTVTLTDAHPVQRVVVRLAEVDARGRSTLIAQGVATPKEPSETYRIVLSPAGHTVRMGYRLRLIISDSDFPRLVPLPEPIGMRIVDIDLRFPSISPDARMEVEMPTVDPPDPAAPGFGNVWTITRDPVQEGIQVTFGSKGSAVHVDGHVFEKSFDVCATVRRDAPDAAVTTGTHRSVVRTASGENIGVAATVRCTQTTMWARGEVSIDGLTTFSKIWEVALPDAAAEIGSETLQAERS